VSAKLTPGCGDKAAEIKVSAAKAASGQKKRGTSSRSRRDTTSVSQHPMAIASSACAAAIEKWSAAATPKTAASPACSSQRGDEGSSCAAISVASAWSGHRALGGLDHLLRLNPGQASEVPGQARSLVARPAGEIGDFHRFGGPERRAPRRRPRRQGRTIQADDWHAARRRDMHWSAVAADVNRRAVHQRAQFRERELAALENPAAIVPEERLCLRDHALAGLPIRRSRCDDDAAGRIATRKSRCHSGKRSDRPSTERVSRADMHHDQPVVGFVLIVCVSATQLPSASAAKTCEALSTRNCSRL